MFIKKGEGTCDMNGMKQRVKSQVASSKLLNIWINHIAKKERSALSREPFLGDYQGAEDALARIYRPPRSEQPEAFYNNGPSLTLSIILPVYNVEDYLDACLSALLQVGDEVPFEVIAVNDGSTDSSRSILGRYDGRFKALKIIDRENGGLSAARNTGLAEARGRYIAFVDSDDVVQSSEMLLAANMLESSDADYISGTYQRINDRGLTFGPRDNVSTLMVPWGRVFRREVWAGIRFPEGYWYEDLIMPFLIEPRFRGVETDALVYSYRDRPGSIVNSTPSSLKGLDSFWLIGYFLDECRRLGIPSSSVFDATLRSMGPTLMGRTTALDGVQMRTLFHACCGIVQGEGGFRTSRCTMGRYWEMLRDSLLTGAFRTWCACCVAISLAEGGCTVKRPLQLLSDSKL